MQTLVNELFSWKFWRFLAGDRMGFYEQPREAVKEQASPVVQATPEPICEGRTPDGSEVKLIPNQAGENPAYFDLLVCEKHYKTIRKKFAVRYFNAFMKRAVKSYQIQAEG